MADNRIVMALVGYGMFGSDVIAGSLWDLQRNGISPYLDRIGLDDRAADYSEVQFELAAVGTRSEASALKAMEDNVRESGKTTKGFHGETPWTDILDSREDIDVLVVATPDHLHTQPTMEALNRGVHVIAEKPMCLNLAEADEIIATARDNDLIVGVDMHKRYDPDHLKIFGELTKDLGEPLYARGVLEEPLEVATTIFKWAEQSDPFTYVGIHWVDLFMHYLKLSPFSLYAVGQKKRLVREFNKNAFDSCQVIVTHTNGFTVIYESNWLTPADFEGPVNQESQTVFEYGKVESDSQYRGLRYWIENKGSRTSNTHFFRKVARPDGTMASQGYGKDSLMDCFEKICRKKFKGDTAADMAGSYPDAASQRLPTAVVHAARECLQRNAEHAAADRHPVVTAGFGSDGITIYDPHDSEGPAINIYSSAL